MKVMKLNECGKTTMSQDLCQYYSGAHFVTNVEKTQLPYKVKNKTKKTKNKKQKTKNKKQKNKTKQNKNKTDL